MLNSTYSRDVDEVAAFEELCGSHGDLGRHPEPPVHPLSRRWSAPRAEIVGAENVHLQFVDWLAQLGHLADADLPDVPNRLVCPRL